MLCFAQMREQETRRLLVGFIQDAIQMSDGFACAEDRFVQPYTAAARVIELDVTFNGQD